MGKGEEGNEGREGGREEVRDYGGIEIQDEQVEYLIIYQHNSMVLGKYN